MKILFLAFLLLVSSAPFAEAHKATSQDAELSTPALKALLDSGVSIVLLDARPDKFAEGKRLPGAKYLSDSASSETVAKAIPSKKSLVVVYCGGMECPLSVELAHHLKSLGYPNVIEYREGIEGWTKAGYPTDPVR